LDKRQYIKQTQPRSKAFSQRIDATQEAIADFCRRHAIRKLSLFGSVLRDDFRADSDIDVLVEFEPGHVPGLAFFAMQDELSQLFGREVELHTAGFLSPYFRNDVEAGADVRYSA
jgi:predicted nucleotidyltransferase